MTFRIFVRNRWVTVLLVVVLFFWSTFAFGGAYDQLRQMGGDPPSVPEPPRPTPVDPQPQPRPEREPRQPREPRERPSSPQRPSQQQQYQQQQRIQEERARAQAAKVAYGQGSECYKRKDWDCAIKNFEGALKNSPNNPKIQSALERARQEARKEREQAERSKKEKEQQQAFERGRKEVLEVVKAQGPQQQNVQKSPHPAGKEIAFGASPSYSTPQRVGGLTEEEWRLARNYQLRIEALERNKKGIFLSGEEAKLMDELLYRRNQLWQKAVSVPGLTAEEKEKLRLKLYTSNLHATPATVTSGQLKIWQDGRSGSRTDGSNPVLEITSDYHTEKLVQLIEDKGEGVAEDLFGERGSKGYGNLLGVGKVAIATKKEGVSSGASEMADFVISKIPHSRTSSRASFAVEGGRQYSNVVHQALTKTMEDIDKFIGRPSNSKEDQEDFKKSMTTGQKTLMKWVGFGDEDK